MALIDKASLLMVPSTYEAGKLYNVLPSGNRAPDSTNQNSGYDQTRADFDFDRGSNASATRRNASGLIEKYRENLLLQSNNFGTTWATTNASVTSGQSGYDGLNNAWELKENTSTGVHEIIQILSVSTGVHTYSLKVSANTRSKMALVLAGSAFNSGGNGVGIFNLTNGTLISSSGSLIDAKITSLGGNWYNVSITKLASSSSAVAVVQLVDDSNNTNYAGNGTGSVLIQSAQLESGLVATDYLDSTSVTGKAGVLVDLPRINYDANGENGSLLLEPSRQNLIQQSEYIHGWLNAGGTSSQNSQDSTTPEGLYNAAVLDASSVRYQTFNISSAAHSYSVYAKAKSGSILGLRIDTPTTKTTNFNLSDGTISSTGSGHTASIEAVGNGWYRCIISFTDSIINAVLQTTSSGSVYTWGAQIEAGSYVSSYIPTMGTSETRAADSCLDGGSAESINSTEGVLYAEIAALSNDVTQRAISLSDGSNTNRVCLLYNDSSNSIRLFVQVGGSTQSSIISTSYTITDSNKIAIKWKANDFALWINGVEVGTDNTGVSFASNTLNTLDFKFPNDTTDFYGNTKQLAVFNEALSDSELATLTTL